MLPMHLALDASILAAAAQASVLEYVGATIRIGTGAAVAYLAYRAVHRLPWPRRLSLRYAAFHLATVVLGAAAWYAVSTSLELLAGWHSDLKGWNRAFEFLLLGSLAYAAVVVISHTVKASAHAAEARAMAARAQLAALRAQLQPHFLFNALHTVVQLIHIDPPRAAEAAELVADLLRVTLDEQRDEVTLADEWRFVSRYLAVERIRFGDRLVVRSELAESLLGERIPAFALQTLVENAVHHGAAPRVSPTEIVVTAAGNASELTLAVRNTGDGTPARADGNGTGLARLRERLGVLYGTAARLESGPTADGGYQAVLAVPRSGRSA